MAEIERKDVVLSKAAQADIKAVFDHFKIRPENT
jgi:hypothetical protein